ncbi:hypothetical protein OAR08_00800 [Flavobacteriaceae bacterium]|nr:hypothetical protein [Flavobacteriaceae bacterium]
MKIKKKDINEEFLIKSLEYEIEIWSSYQNLSGILAGFSLGSVAAIFLAQKPETLLYLDNYQSNIIVDIVFGISIVSSLIFTIVLLNTTFLLETLKTNSLYIKFTPEIEIKYEIVKDFKTRTNVTSYLFLVAIFLFVLVILSISFTVNLIFGSILSILFLSYIFNNLLRLKKRRLKRIYFEGKKYNESERDFFNWNKSYNDLED